MESAKSHDSKERILSEPIISQEQTDDDPSAETQCLYSAELKLIKSLSPPKKDEIISRKVRLGEKEKKYTLFLDLDGTLVFSRVISGNKSGDSFVTSIRPHAKRLLEELSRLYEIIIFTASCEDYAMKVVDLLDPSGKFIKGVLSRNYCIPISEGYYIKDLRIIDDRKMEEMLIVDNSILCFSFQLENGVPVTSYEGQEEDNELELLVSYLKNIYNEKNIVEANKKNIGLMV